MSTNQATVETLTAEVRILTVGNRQITQSVAKQLDQVPIEQVEPFGRVKLSGNDFLGRYVIGSDTMTGALVLSSVPYPYERIWYTGVDSSDIPEGEHFTVGWQRIELDENDSGYFTATIPGIERHGKPWRFRITADTTRVTERPKGAYRRSEWVYPDGFDPEDAQLLVYSGDLNILGDTLRPLAEKTWDSLDHIEKAWDMPLIVLAGLR